LPQEMQDKLDNAEQQDRDQQRQKQKRQDNKKQEFGDSWGQEEKDW